MRNNKLIPITLFTTASFILIALFPPSFLASLQPNWLPRSFLLLSASILAYMLVVNVTPPQQRQEPILLDQDTQQPRLAPYTLMIDGVEDYAIMMLDPGGRVISWNQGAARFAGYERDEILGEHISIFYPPEAELQQGPEQMLQQAVEKGSLRTEGWRLRKDGSRFWAEVLLTSLTNTEGELVGFTKIVRDITSTHETQQELQRKRTQLSLAQEIANLGSWEWDLVENKMYWSDQLSRIYGQDPENFSPSYEHFLECQHPEDRARVEQIINESLDSSRNFEFLHRILRPDGEERTINARGMVEIDERGKPVRLVGTAQDVSERKTLEETLLLQSTLNLSVVETLNELGVGILIFNARQILFSNPSLHDILDLEVGSIESPSEIVSEARIDPTSVLGKILKNELDISKMKTGRTTLHQRGGIEYIEFASTFASLGHDTRTVLILQNITDQREDELRLKASRGQLRRYSQRQSRAIEEERARLSREIHDVLGQHLTAMKMDLGSLGQRLAMRDIRDSQDLLTQVHELSRLVDTTIKTARQLATELRPSVLDDLGLAAAIEWVAKDMANKSDFKVALNSNSDFSDLDREVATAMFRICQEALTNTARHAQASLVELTLERHDGHIELEIKDNGIGISELDLTENSSSLGIVGMRERATAVNGKLVIAPRYTGGTLVKVIIPNEGEAF